MQHFYALHIALGETRCLGAAQDSTASWTVQVEVSQVSKRPNAGPKMAFAQLQLAGAYFTHLEFGKRPVWRLVEVREGEAVCLVGAQALHPSQHPVVVPHLLGLGDVLRRPGAVPRAPVLVLPPTYGGVGLQKKG